MSTISELQERASVVKNENNQGANTAERIGGLFYDVVEFMGSQEEEIETLNGKLEQVNRKATKNEDDIVALNTKINKIQSYSAVTYEEAYLGEETPLDQLTHHVVICINEPTLDPGEAVKNVVYVDLPNASDWENFEFRLFIAPGTGNVDTSWVQISCINDGLIHNYMRGYAISEDEKDQRAVQGLMYDTLLFYSDGVKWYLLSRYAANTTEVESTEVDPTEGEQEG